jgi:regulator of sigma E protease
MILSIIVFLFILGILVFVHELGHFLVAKAAGMRVDEFSIGFPPRLFKKRKGDTLYSINAIPFGGYVKIHGENFEGGAPTDDDARSFDHKPVWMRMLVILAGITMNLVFAFVVLTVAFSVGFVSVAQDLTQIPGATVTQGQVLITDIVKGSTADQAGVKAGDYVTKATDVQTGTVTQIGSVSTLIAYTKAEQAKGAEKIKLTIDRDGVTQDKEVAISHEGTPIGVIIQPVDIVRIPFWRAPGAAVKEIGYIVGITWDALKGFGKRLFVHGQLDPTVSGPIGIYQATASATHAGVVSTVFLLVVLSINLALFNVLPIPALDGGKFLFLVIEAVFGKKAVNRKFESIVVTISFILIIGLIIVLSVRDISKFF